MHQSQSNRCALFAVIVIAAMGFNPTAGQEPKPTPAQKAFAVAYQQAIDLWDQGNHRQSVTMYERALVLCEKAYGKNSNYSGIVAFNVGNGWTHLSDYAKAESFFRRSIAISEAKMDPKVLGLNPSIEQLMLIFAQQGQLNKAEKLINSAIQKRTRKLGKTHPAVSTLWFYLAHAYLVSGDYEAAEKASKTSLAIRVDVNGPKHGIVSM